MAFKAKNLSTLKNTNSLYLSEDGGNIYEIKYNPEVTGFKYVVSESSVQTLGSKYPTIRRNGATGYYQFNISGLISCEVNDNSVEGDDDREKERNYRKDLMDFLCNDKIKLFQSYTEGEMMVRLMNVSFTPNKQLGRNIYSFSAQVNEIDEVDENKLARED